MPWILSHPAVKCLSGQTNILFLTAIIRQFDAEILVMRYLNVAPPPSQPLSQALTLTPPAMGRHNEMSQVDLFQPNTTTKYGDRFILKTYFLSEFYKITFTSGMVDNRYPIPVTTKTGRYPGALDSPGPTAALPCPDSLVCSDNSSRTQSSRLSHPPPARHGSQPIRK